MISKSAEPPARQCCVVTARRPPLIKSNSPRPSGDARGPIHETMRNLRNICDEYIVIERSGA